MEIWKKLNDLNKKINKLRLVIQENQKLMIKHNEETSEKLGITYCFYTFKIVL